MENYIENIDLINAYLGKTLSESEKQVFESRLETNSEFNQLYNEQLAILEGINRVGLKAEINAAKQSYVRAKWMKYIGVSVGAILISALIYSFIFKSETSQIVKPVNNTIEIVSDSIVIGKSSEEKIEEEIVIVERVEEKITSQEEEIVKTEKPKIESKPVIEKQIVEIIKAKPKGLKPEPTSSELISFFKSIKKTPQIIEVNTEKEFVVTCKEGTVLTIPAKSFIDAKTGKLARGKINLEVTEYYKLSDMLLGNLTTKSDDKQLETGGMLYLDANKKGKKLKLKSGKRIKMAFNDKGKKNMQLFSGEESSEGVNWKLEDQTGYISNSIKRVFDFKVIEKDVKVSFSEVDEVPLFQKCKEKKDNHARRYCMENEILKFVESKFNVTIAKNLGLTGAHDINTYFEIETDGTIGKIKIRASNKELGDEMIRVIESMPKLVPGKHNGIVVKTVYYLPFEVMFKGQTIKQQLITVQSDRQFTNAFEKRVDSIKSSNGNIATISNTDIQRYVFGLTRLGWVNLDRFMPSKKGRVKFKLKIKDPKGTNVKMIFKSISSILPSKQFADEFDFGLLPIDEEVVLIAIKKTDDKLFLAKKEMITKRNPDLSLEFKEVTIQELKSELESLNSSF